ncbi:transposase [Neoroseomonas alba]|uniref:transposase n=1 Tax=Roseomonas alba TaxID=2846776 RepID=UPI0038CF807C
MRRGSRPAAAPPDAPSRHWASALRQAESRTAVEEICRKPGVSEPTFYRRKKQFAGMGVAEMVTRALELPLEATCPNDPVDLALPGAHT